MRKNVWEMGKDDIAVMHGKRFRWHRDFRQHRPGMGMTLIRELINIDEKEDVSWFIRGIEVEIEAAEKGSE